MLKHRFLFLREGVSLAREDETASLCFAGVILHNMSVGDGEFENCLGTF